MTVRAKLRLTSMVTHYYSSDARTLRFQCEYDTSIPEDQRFQKATPSGSIEITVDNPVAVDQFQLGKSYYVDFSPA